MRASSFASGQEKGPLIIGAPTSIFYRKVTALSPASNQVPALKIANQLSYGNSNYSYNGEPAPNFYGYSGVGIGPQNARTEAEIKQWTFAVFVVPGNQPTQKVTFVNEGREPRAPGASSNLQSYFEAVPMPEIGKVPSGRLNPETGTDQYLCVWQPNTNKMWEMWRLREEGGEYSFQYGGFIEDLNKWDGIAPHGWGAMATGLSQPAGIITLQDLVEVLMGKPIKHALAFSFPNTIAAGPVAPADRHDEQESVPEEWEGKPNPAHGKDGVAESSWFRFPPGSAAAEHGITKLLEVAIFNAVRDYGLFVANSSGSVSIQIEWPGVLGSPYAWPSVNPLAGAPSAWGTFSWIPSSLTNPSLGVFSEEIKGASSCFSKQPWQLLEALEPRLS